MIKELMLLDENFSPVYPVDDYGSLTWAEKFLETGMLNLELPETAENIERINNSLYLYNSDSSTLMRLTKYTISHNNGFGKIKVEGESLEGILKNRQIYTTVKFSNATLIDVVSRLLQENCINVNGSIKPTTPAGIQEARNIPNIVSCDFTNYISSAKLTEIYDQSNRITADIEMGTELYSTIQKYCEALEVGIRIVRYYSGQPNEDWSSMAYWEFQLYSGNDRTRGNQEGNDAVVYSDDFDNLLSYEYTKDLNPPPTDFIVKGTFGTTKVTTMTNMSPYSGVYRREMIDDVDIDSTGYTQSNYKAAIKAMAESDLKTYIPEEEMTAEIEPEFSFVPKKDYDVGDIIEVYTTNGIRCKCRIDSMYYGMDDAGYHIYPKFTAIPNNS